MQLRRLQRPRQQLSVQLDGALVLAKADTGHGVQGAVVTVGAVGG